MNNVLTLCLGFNGKKLNNPLICLISFSFVIVEDASKIPFGPFVAGMASCHSLTVIDDQIRGDPLDVQMFQSIKWVGSQKHFCICHRWT